MAYDNKIKNEDIRMSNIVGKFVKENFYDRLTIGLWVITDKDTQCKGIDTIFEYNGNKYQCDEKSAIRWRNLKTFSLELSFLNKNDEEQIGWFLSDKCVNDTYLFVWIDHSKSDYGESKNIVDITDIDEAEIALVRKSDIKDYLNSLGWTQENLLKKSNNIRYSGDRNFGNIFKQGVKFSYSERLNEKPINILLSREKLVELAIVSQIYTHVK